MNSLPSPHFLVNPMERHEFIADPKGFYCSVCARPRALHLHDGFIPSNGPLNVSMDPAVRFGPHPRWFRPGTLRLNAAEQEQMDKIYSKKRKVQPGIMAGKLGPEQATVAKPQSDTSGTNH